MGWWMLAVLAAVLIFFAGILVGVRMRGTPTVPLAASPEPTPVRARIRADTVSVANPGPATYKRRLSQPRYQPLPEHAWG